MVPFQEVSDSPCYYFNFTSTRLDKIWSIAALSELELPGLHLPASIVQKRMWPCGWWIIYYPVNPFSQTKHYIARLSLLYYFHGKSSDKLHSLVSAILTFSAKTYHTMYTETNYLHFLCNPLVRRKFHSDSVFPRITTLWNKLPIGCFPNYYSLNFFKSMVNRYFYITS